MTSWPLAQLLNLMQKKIADKSKYKVIPVLYIFFKKIINGFNLADTFTLLRC